MRHLNYNHLLYFWSVAREGSVTRAAETLFITPQTISGQLRLLEQAVGDTLFQRVGRGLVLTEMGRMVYQYADEIFTLGGELSRLVRSKVPFVPATFQVGVVDSIAKLIACRILEPVLDGETYGRVICAEGELERLLADLAVHRLDLVLSDRPLPADLHVKAFSHLLGESAVGLFATPALAAEFRGGFPASVAEAPLLLPLPTNVLRRGVDDWLERQRLAPPVVAECGDSALLKAFGQQGRGLFPAPIAIAAQVGAMYGVELVGELEGVSERYYALSPERRLKHPASVAITESARSVL